MVRYLLPLEPEICTPVPARWYTTLDARCLRLHATSRPSLPVCNESDCRPGSRSLPQRMSMRTLNEPARASTHGHRRLIRAMENLHRLEQKYPLSANLLEPRLVRMTRAEASQAERQQHRRTPQKTFPQSHS